MMEPLERLDMEQVLRRALNIHVQSVQESAKSLSRAKDENERLQDQNKHLQKENSDLHVENRKLQSSVSGDQNREGRCCEVVRHSLEMVISSYKQLVEEKDGRIKRLEEDVRRYKRKLIHMTDSLDLSCTPLAPPVTLQHGGSNPTPSRDELPDTTSTAQITSFRSPARPDSSVVQPALLQGVELSDRQRVEIGQQEGAELGNPRGAELGNPRGAELGNPRGAELDNPRGAELDDCVFSKNEANNAHTGQGQKLRLQRRGNKRSRYTEEISPEQKRRCQISPTSDNVLNKESSREVDKRTHSKAHSRHSEISPSTSEAKNVEKHRKRGQKQKYQVLAPDTCVTNTDDTLTADGTDAAGHKEDDMVEMIRKKCDKTKSGVIEDEADNPDDMNMIVPETLAVDMDGFNDSDDEENYSDSAAGTDRNSPEKLSGIIEVMESSGQFGKDQDIAGKVKDQINDSVNKRDADLVDENRSTSSENQSTISEIRSINVGKKVTSVADPEKESTREFSLRNVLYRHSNGRESSDEEEATMKEVLDGSAIVCVTDDDDGDDTMTACSQTFGKSRSKKKTQNKKEKLKEIDDLFNSPSETDANPKQSGNKGVAFGNRKQLFKKQKSFDEVDADVILRRSPRKHKISSVSNVVNKSLSKLATGRKLIDKIDTEFDPDMTVDPNDMTENQSLDCYNVIPIRNGEPVSDNLFQVKVSRRHHRTEDGTTEDKTGTSVRRHRDGNIPAGKRKTVTINTQMNETLKSPSLFCNGGKSKKKSKDSISQSGEVVTVSSPSVEVVSDPESPLLLKRDTSSTSEANESQWTSKALGKKQRKSSNISVNTRTHSRNVSLKGNSRLSRSAGNLKGCKSSKVDLETSSTDKHLFISVGKGQHSGKKLLQTTLTQGFFGSKDEGSGDDEDSDGSDVELQEALRQSLEESNSGKASQALGEDTDGCIPAKQAVSKDTDSCKANRTVSKDTYGCKANQTVSKGTDAWKANQILVEDTDGDVEVIITKPGTPFKKPSNIPLKRESLSRRRKKALLDNQLEVVKSDRPTEDVDGEECRILQEIQNQDSNVDGAGDQINVVGNQINGSLDPAAELSELCQEPELSEVCPMESLPSLDIAADFRQEELQSASQCAVRGDDSQDIPCSSRSYTFGPRRKVKTETKPGMENVPPGDHSRLLTDSFDRPPKKKDITVAHVSVVRKRDERQKLQGHGCKQCLEYYRAAGRSEDEVSRHMQQCSRHRANHPPPDTPPHFWSVGFVDTQECLDRGYLKIEDVNNKDDAPSHRRRRRLNKYFRSKNEASYLDCDSQDSPEEIDAD